MAEPINPAGARLNTLLTQAGYDPLDPTLVSHFEDYLSLILRWNAHVNLTAIRDEEGILSRHFVESIACARALPAESLRCWTSVLASAFPEFPSPSAVQK